jgi:mevalonate kinase
MAVNLYAEARVRKGVEAGIHVSSRGLKAAGLFHGGRYKAEVGGKAGGRLLRPIKIAAEAVLDYAGSPPLDLDVEVESGIPIQVGLGSSAAMAVSTVAAVARFVGLKLSREEVLRLSYFSERLLHYRPSGIDQATCIHGGIIFFQQGAPVKFLKAARPLRLVVGNTGIRRSTGVLVKKVSSLAEEREALMRKNLKAARRLTLQAAEAIRRGDLPQLGRCMDENQKLLSAVGVSHKRLELFIEAARNAGALGAKLTGGGGGGCMIALARGEDLENVAKALQRLHGETYLVETDERGLRSWVGKGCVG